MTSKMSHSDSAETTEGDETTAAEMIESKMETMRMTIEDLEDAVVLMRQAIASQPSSNIHIFGHSPAIVPREETELNGKLKSKKEKKSKRSKLGKRHASSPGLMLSQLPSDPSLQPLPSPVWTKMSIGKSGSLQSKCRPSGHKHSREESSSTIVPSIVEHGPSSTELKASGHSLKSGMRRSHSHSGAKLFEQLFQKRSLGRSAHRNTISIPNPSYPLDIHSAPATPLIPSPRSSSQLGPTTLPVLDPLAILRDMETYISNLRHQHSSMLTLLPLSTHTRSRSPTTWSTSGTSTISDGSSGRDYFGTPTQSRRQSRDPDTTVTQGSSMISPKAQAAQLRGLSSDLSLEEALTAPNKQHDQQSEQARIARQHQHRHHHHQHQHHHSRPNGVEKSQSTMDREHHHRRETHYNHRSSLSSLYAEVASIYYDAEVEPDSEEVFHRTPTETTSIANQSSSDDDNEMERVLQREVSRHDSDDHTAVGSNLSKISDDDESGTSTPKLSGTEPGKSSFAVSAPHPHYSGPIIRRSALPAPAPRTEPSLIGMLKKNVGKDMSTIAFDVSFNEPISLLQKLAEEVEYFDLLKLANLAIDPTERLAHVAAFAISQYASAKYRSVRKPFNPLQGETYELYREDLGLRFISEKVNHHPPKFAAKADGKGWAYACTSAGKNRLAGMSLEIQPLGAQHVTLIDQAERYTWTKPLSYMRNLIAGTKYLETIGEMIVTNETNGEKCVITFKDGGWSGATRNHVTGVCYKGDSKTKAAWIDGIWDSHLDIRYGGPKDPAHPLWIVHPWPTKPELNYGFAKWAIGLNELTPDLVGVIAPSDSRLRPDQRLLEEGRFTEADQLKLKLEETQRKRKNEGHEVQPRWFKAANAAEDEWTYNGGYWEAREEGTLNTKAVAFLFDSQQ